MTKHERRANRKAALRRIAEALVIQERAERNRRLIRWAEKTGTGTH